MSRRMESPMRDHVSIDGPLDPFDAIFDSLHARPNALNMIRTSRRLMFTTSTDVVFFFRRTPSVSSSEPPMNSHLETAAATAGGVWARDEMGKSRGSACCVW